MLDPGKTPTGQRLGLALSGNDRPQPILREMTTEVRSEFDELMTCTYGLPNQPEIYLLHSRHNRLVSIRSVDGDFEWIPIREGRHHLSLIPTATPQTPAPDNR